MHEITATTLVIVASADTVTRHLLIGQNLVGHIPGAEFKTVNRRAHMRFWEALEETCRAIVEFLRDH